MKVKIEENWIFMLFENETDYYVMRTWLDDNIPIAKHGDRDWIICPTDNNYVWFIKFNNDEDYTAFKLRWVE